MSADWLGRARRRVSCSAWLRRLLWRCAVGWWVLITMTIARHSLPDWRHVMTSRPASQQLPSVVVPMPAAERLLLFQCPRQKRTDLYSE